VKIIFLNSMKTMIANLKKFVDRLWYPPLLGLCALLDNFLLVFPMDGMLISSTLITPRRWISLAIWTGLGSTLGAIGLASLSNHHGLPWVTAQFPGINETEAWILTLKFFNNYGLLLVFLVAATPLVQQPTVILAGLAKTPLVYLIPAIFFGRLIKYLIITYVSAYAPKLLSRLWGVQREMKEAGVRPLRE
jgi:membrane protein YqaA with SNARE-associated domain